MACERGFWLLDQTAALFGAWLISVGCFSLVAGVSVLVVAGVAALRWMAETPKARREPDNRRVRGRATLN